MSETQWNIEEVRRLKKIRLVQYNLGILVLFVLFGYLVEKGKATILLGLLCAFSWLITAITLYTLNTGNPIGTKISRRVQEFDRDRWGEKHWKRDTLIAAVIISVLSVALTVRLFFWSFDTIGLDFTFNALIFIFAWVAYNLAEIFRIKNL